MLVVGFFADETWDSATEARSPPERQMLVSHRLAPDGIIPVVARTAILVDLLLPHK